jgi:GT2 family glycosyltransferase
MPKVAVVILNWNGKALLQKFLPSVVMHSGDAEIWVADNYSTDDSLDFVKQNYPQIKIVTNAVNGGFAKGYNDSLKRIPADYYILLNSDVEVCSNWINPIIQMMENDHLIAACQPKIMAYNQKDYFEYAGAAGGFMDKYDYPFCRGRLFDTVEKDLHQYDNIIEIFWASGAALFIRAKCFFEVDGFDEIFFSHMEEIDLCWRLKNRGYKVMFNPFSLVYHVGGATLAAYNPKKTYLNFRNNLFLITKNQFQGILFFNIFRRLILDGVAGVKYVFEGKGAHCLAIIKAHLHFYELLGSFLVKRKNQKSLIKMPNTHGRYQNWVVWEYFVKGKKNFSDLPRAGFH